MVTLTLFEFSSIIILVLYIFLKLRGKIMETKYLSLKEMSAKWGISDRRINTLCLENRIPGAFKVGNSWAIPADAEKPVDERIKSGKYVMERKMSNVTE